MDKKSISVESPNIYTNPLNLNKGARTGGPNNNKDPKMWLLVLVLLLAILATFLP